MENLCGVDDLNFLLNSDLDCIFERILQRHYENEVAWRESLPAVVDAITMKLKQFEETDWKSGQRGRLKEEGLVLLGNVVKKQIEYINRKSTQVCLFYSASPFLQTSKI